MTDKIRWRVTGDEHSNHGLTIGAIVDKAPRPPGWAEGSEGVGDDDWFSQGGDGDEVAIDPRDREEVVTGETIVLGNNYWGKGKDRDEALAQFIKHGGRPGLGYTVVTFDDDTEFVGVHSVDGAVSWRGNEPTHVDVPPYRDVDQDEVSEIIAHIRGVCREAGLKDLAPLLITAFEDEGTDPDKMLAFNPEQAWVIWDEIYSPATAAIAGRFA